MYEYTKLIDELYSSNYNYVKTLLYKDNIIDSKIRTIEFLEQEIIDLENINKLQQENLDIANKILLEIEFENSDVDNE